MTLLILTAIASAALLVGGVIVVALEVKSFERAVRHTLDNEEIG